MTENKETNLGDSVIDSEDDNPNEAIVVWKPENKTITDWEYEKDEETFTTADENPEYPEDEPLVVVSYRQTLEDHWPEWQETDPENLFESTKEQDINQYGFPEGRLEPIEPGELESQWLDGLGDRLENAGWDVTKEPTELVVQQFGEEYRITADGTVEGTGDYRTPLENLIENYRN